MMQRRLTIHEIPPTIPRATRVLLTEIAESSWHSMVPLLPAIAKLEIKVEKKKVELVFTLPSSPFKSILRNLVEIGLDKKWIKQIREALKKLGAALFYHEFPELSGSELLYYGMNWHYALWQEGPIEVKVQKDAFPRFRVEDLILQYVEKAFGLQTPSKVKVGPAGSGRYAQPSPIEKLLRKKFPFYSLRNTSWDQLPAKKKNIFKNRETFNGYMQSRLPTIRDFRWIEKTEIKEWVDTRNELIRKDVIDENCNPKVPLQRIEKLLQEMLHPPLTCPVCKKRLIQRKKDQKTCGKAKCRQKLYRARKKQKEGR